LEFREKFGPQETRIMGLPGMTGHCRLMHMMVVIEIHRATLFLIITPSFRGRFLYFLYQ